MTITIAPYKQVSDGLYTKDGTHMDIKCADIITHVNMEIDVTPSEHYMLDITTLQDIRQAVSRLCPQSTGVARDVLRHYRCLREGKKT